MKPDMQVRCWPKRRVMTMMVLSCERAVPRGNASPVRHRAEGLRRRKNDERALMAEGRGVDGAREN